MNTSNKFYKVWVQTGAVFISSVFILLSSCASTKLTMTPSYEFKLRKNESSVAWVNKDEVMSNYWTARLKKYLSDRKLKIADYTSIQDITYSYLLINNMTDSSSLVKLGKLTDFDYLIIGSFGAKSENTGRGIDILDVHEQIYHYEDFERWRDFELVVYNLSTGYRDLFLTAKTTSWSIGYGGDDNPNDNNPELYYQAHLASNYKTMNKSFKKALKQICD